MGPDTENVAADNAKIRIDFHPLSGGTLILHQLIIKTDACCFAELRAWDVQMLLLSRCESVSSHSGRIFCEFHALGLMRKSRKGIRTKTKIAHHGWARSLGPS